MVQNMSMPVTIDSSEALRGFVESRISRPLLGTMLRATFDAFRDAFVRFYGRLPSGERLQLEALHPLTAVNTIPGLVRSLLESRFPTIAQMFLTEQVDWSHGANTTKNHGHFELLIGDDLKIIVTKYNNGTEKINLNKKKKKIAEMNGTPALFPELLSEDENADSRHTVYIVYGYDSNVYDSTEFDIENVNYIHLLYAGKDAMSGKSYQYTVDLMEYASSMPMHSIAIAPVVVDEEIVLLPNTATEIAANTLRLSSPDNVSLVSAADEEIELEPNRDTEDQEKRKSEN